MLIEILVEENLMPNKISYQVKFLVEENLMAHVPPKHAPMSLLENAKKKKIT